MTVASRGVRIPAQVREAIEVHAINCFPEEACGLIAADEQGEIRMAYPLTNQLASSTNYTIEPTEHFRALRHAQRQGWELVGVFHSHPHSPAYPSPTDVGLAAEPDWLYLLVSLQRRQHPELRGFRIRDGEITEQTIEFI